MSKITRLQRLVSPKIQNRGRDYFQRDTVEILFADPDFVSARVSGTLDYEVDLERDNETLVYSCDCPFFEDHLEVCKHIWATLLKLEKDGHLNQWPDSFPAKLAASTGMDDEDDDLEDIDFEDIPDDPRTGFRSVASRHLSVSPARSWQNLLGRIKQPPDLYVHIPSWPTGREILYVIETTRRSDGTGLVIQIDCREPKKAGGWKKPKPLSISHDMLLHLPDPADREILTRLVGVQRETWYYGAYESIYRFEPADFELDKLLPVISETGRLFVRTPAGDVRPVRWDGRSPWEFRIDVRPDTETGRWHEAQF